MTAETKPDRPLTDKTNQTRVLLTDLDKRVQKQLHEPRFKYQSELALGYFAADSKDVLKASEEAIELTEDLNRDLRIRIN